MLVGAQAYIDYWREGRHLLRPGKAMVFRGSLPLCLTADVVLPKTKTVRKSADLFK